MTAPSRGRPRSFDRSRALERAMRLFWERGYEATSVRDLTSELGIGAPSLYSAFGGKEELFDEAVRLYSDGYGLDALRELDEAPSAEEAVARVLRSAAHEYTRPDLPHGCMVINADRGTTNPVVTDLLRDRRAETTRAIRDRISTDVDSGVLPADTDAEALARYLYTVLLGMSHAAADGASADELERTAELALRVFPPPHS